MMNKPTRWYSNRHEKSVAKAVSGNQVVNSGATAFSKGDVTTDKFLIEAKTTTTVKESFSIKRDWLTKNEEEAFAMNKPYSALVFNFGAGDNYYVIDEQLFVRLVKLLEEVE